MCGGPFLVPWAAAAAASPGIAAAPISIGTAASPPPLPPGRLSGRRRAKVVHRTALFPTLNICALPSVKC